MKILLPSFSFPRRKGSNQGDVVLLSLEKLNILLGYYENRESDVIQEINNFINNMN
jgi:hypothetical protein